MVKPLSLLLESSLILSQSSYLSQSDVLNAGPNAKQNSTSVRWQRDIIMVNKIHTPASAAEELMHEYSFKTMRDNKAVYIYIPESGIYQEGAESIIEEETQSIFGEDTSNYNVREVIGIIKRSTGIDRDAFDSDNGTLCTANGILDIENRELKPFSPGSFYLSQLPVDYRPDADCPNFKKFLSEIVDPQYQKLLIEFLGYLLISRYIYKHYFILVGKGDNGKSVFLNTINHLLGKWNVANYSIQVLAEDKNAVAELYGKKANIYADLPKETLRHPSTIKMLTGDDRISARRLYQQYFSFWNKAKLIFSCNEIPLTLEADDAFYQRGIIIPFEKVFTRGVNMDEHLLEKITTPGELSGILNLALDGKTVLTVEHGFDYTNDVEKLKQLHHTHSGSTISKYYKDRLVENPKVSTPKMAILKDYFEWTDSRNETTISESKFFRELRIILPKSKFPNDRPLINGQQIYCIKGVELKL